MPMMKGTNKKRFLISSQFFLCAVFKTGMNLPGSRPDVMRTKLLSGPSPVGGAFGGMESSRVLTLDEFELQAAHYNMACAYAQLGNAVEVRLPLVLPISHSVKTRSQQQSLGLRQPTIGI